MKWYNLFDYRNWRVANEYEGLSLILKTKTLLMEVNLKGYKNDTSFFPLEKRLFGNNQTNSHAFFIYGGRLYFVKQNTPITLIQRLGVVGLSPQLKQPLSDFIYWGKFKTWFLIVVLKIQIKYIIIKNKWY